MLPFHYLGGSRLSEYVNRIVREDMLHQFQSYALLNQLAVTITLQTPQVGDKKYAIGTFLEALTGERAQVRTLKYADDYVDAPLLYGKESSGVGQATFATGAAQGRKSSKNAATNNSNAQALKFKGLRDSKKGAPRLTTDDYKRLSGSASGVSFTCVLEGDGMYQFIEKLRQVYLPDRDALAYVPKKSAVLLEELKGNLKNPCVGAFSSMTTGRGIFGKIAGLNGTTFAPYPLLASRQSSFAYEMKLLENSQQQEQVAREMQTDKCPLIEKKRRDYMARYYQVWDPSAALYAKEKRHPIQTFDNPSIAVTTLTLPIHECLRFPDIETNFDLLSSLFQDLSSTAKLLIRPTLEIHYPASPSLLSSSSSHKLIEGLVSRGPLPEHPPTHDLATRHHLTMMDYFLSQLFNPFIDRLYYPHVPTPHPNQFT
jgi:hypothetical protein